MCSGSWKSLQLYPGGSPPSVAEYLLSANNNLLVSLIMHDEEDDNVADEHAEDKALCYHMILDNIHNNLT
jgi:hypothetical protein